MTHIRNSSVSPANSAPNVVTHPSFISGSAGSFFCIRSSSKQESDSVRSHTVLLVPPFAEEMNRSRRFFTKLRRQLHIDGVQDVVQPDLYGTGDSMGHFYEATWQIWLADLYNLLEKQATQNFQFISLVGVRAGCLLINELLCTLKLPVNRVVYVQPQSSGYDVVHHLIRMRVASARFSGKSTENTSELWNLLEEGNTIELGGYAISSELALELKSKKLELQCLAQLTTGCYIELVGDSVSAEMPGGWTGRVLVAKPFWQLYEHEPEDELVAAVARSVIAAH